MVKKAEPMTGIIQCTLSRTDQPNQNRQIGRAWEPTNVSGRIISGLNVGLLNGGIMPCFTYSKVERHCNNEANKDA